jgi:heat shock protein HslJ
MMKKRFIFVLCLSLSVFACSKTDNDNEAESTKIEAVSLQNNEQIYWVNSLKSECTGVGSMECLQVQKGNELKPDGWTLLYSPIKGFEFEQGYIYKIIVKEEAVPAEKVPADGASTKYSLVKVIQKNRDDSLKLNDIWALESINGETLDLENGEERPRLEINLHKKQIFGSDGCNNFSGGIKSLDEKSMIFGAIISTRKACMNMETSNKFNQNMANVQSYSLEGLKLHLNDIQGNELFVFRKVD